MMMFLGKGTGVSSSSCNNDSSGLDKFNGGMRLGGSYISSNTDKSSKSKAESSSGNDQEIPHMNDLYEYLISQKGSRHMQQFIKKEANHD